MLIGSDRYLALGQGLGNETASAANSLCCGLGEGVLGSGIVMG